MISISVHPLGVCAVTDKPGKIEIWTRNVKTALLHSMFGVRYSVFLTPNVEKRKSNDEAGKKLAYPRRDEMISCSFILFPSSL